MTEFQRFLAFDVGDRRIGIAVSDLLGITAQPVETYTRTDDEERDIRYLLSVAEKYAPVRLVFGMPRNMNGTYGPQAEKVKAFAGKLLEHWDGEFDFYDERLTTVTAERILLEADVSRKKRKKVVDKIAAVVILQGYMDSRRYV
ncbi:MAG: Holliday junction resolvase RuvX [Clostridia bacterium]|nr:Holliday junction resolvase RuvX [Clostridia bacterium]